MLEIFSELFYPVFDLLDVFFDLVGTESGGGKIGWLLRI